MRRSLKLLLAAALVSASAMRVHAELVDAITAVVADSIITLQQIGLTIAQPEQLAREQFRNDPDKYQEKHEELFTNGLELLVERELILHDFDVSGFNFPESIIDEIVQDRINELYGNRVQFIKTLQSEGMTLEGFRKKVRDDLIIGEMTRKYVPEPIISPRAIQDYYTNHLEDFKVSDQVKTRMIVINQPVPDDPGAARRRAEGVLTQLKGGAAFEDMARGYSDGSQRYQGGENGWQEVSVMNKALLEPLAKLKPGEYSDIIETPEACFIILLEERRTAHYRPLSELREDIERTLAIGARRTLHDRWIERLKKKTFKAYF
jgi:peptidyl-prolyl cis-trans isomerase SurA